MIWRKSKRVCDDSKLVYLLLLVHVSPRPHLPRHLRLEDTGRNKEKSGFEYIESDNAVDALGA